MQALLREEKGANGTVCRQKVPLAGYAQQKILYSRCKVDYGLKNTITVDRFASVTRNDCDKAACCRVRTAGIADESFLGAQRRYPNRVPHRCRKALQRLRLRAFSSAGNSPQKRL